MRKKEESSRHPPSHNLERDSNTKVLAGKTFQMRRFGKATARSCRSFIFVELDGDSNAWSLLLLLLHSLLGCLVGWRANAGFHLHQRSADKI